MKNLDFVLASVKDIEFISEVYNENIDALHGNIRDYDTWSNLLLVQDQVYYLVKNECNVAWFRIDKEDDMFWLGMLQVKPKY